MSWERYHFFSITNVVPVTHLTLEEANPEHMFNSRSDCFGFYLEVFFKYFNDFHDLHFLQWRDDLSWEQCNTQANIFNPVQQSHIIHEIDRLFEKLCQNIDVLYKYQMTYPGEFKNGETLHDWIECAAQYINQNNQDNFHIENFFDVLCALHLTKQYFQQAYTQNAFLIYKTVKP